MTENPNAAQTDALRQERRPFSRRRRRLEAEIATFRARVGLDSRSGASATPIGMEKLLPLVQVAERQLARGCIDEGWHAMFAAYREEFSGMSETERSGRARILLAEAASGKLGEWRGAAVKELIGDPGKTPNEASIRLAAEVRDEALENDYRKLGYLGSHLRRMAIVIAVDLVAIFLVMRLDRSSPLRLSEAGNLASIGYVLLFGILGGAVSAVRPVRGRSARLPELLETWATALLRPLLGGASALALLAFAEANFLGFRLAGETRSAALLAFAFAAGFSERLVMRAVEEAAKRVGGGSPGKDEGKSS